MIAVLFGPGAEAGRTRVDTIEGDADDDIWIGSRSTGGWRSEERSPARPGWRCRSRQSRTVTQRGMVGGGLVRFEQGEANFSLFASRMIFAEDEAEVVVGSVIWVDDAVGLTLRSTAITEYIVPEVQPEQGSPRQILRDDERQRRGRVSIRARAHRRGSARDRRWTWSILTVGEGARHGPKRDSGQRPRIQLHGQWNGRHRRYPGARVEIDLETGVAQPEPRLTAGAAHRNLRMCVATATTSPCWLVAVTVAVVVARAASAATIS